MAEAVAIGALSVAASVASNWMEPTTFPARHEESHRKEMDRLQKNTDHWYKGISDQEVNSDEELEFQKRFVGAEHERKEKSTETVFRTTKIPLFLIP
ncbi:hypothetical protein BT96DRAFT_917738 [Gymnopus androsaceus JB14]|uniref:Uncharacterized protein n=1 Tax=Gymnopus androsaceus JB14 TaxID=1447944 RepID=A0A6A4HYM8_9AGAR|nr:hypothetical protein BT96DRAFT_917738 [Gymnopus androsaceus JB14]